MQSTYLTKKKIIIVKYVPLLKKL